MVKTSDFESENSGSSPGEAATGSAENDFKKLVTDLMTAHPLPWSKGWTCSDTGNINDTIEDAYNRRIYNGETGYLSDEAFNLLINFPELAEDMLESIK